MTTRIAPLGLLLLAACGGGGEAGGPAGPALNRYTGTITVTSALPAGTTSCVTTQTVTFSAAGVSTFAAFALDANNTIEICPALTMTNIFKG